LILQARAGRHPAQQDIANFVLVQQHVVKLAMTAVDYPPMQDPASFNLDAVKKKIDAMIKEKHGQ